MILKENGASEDMIIAGLLHDTLEDTDITQNDIKKEFGEKILELVLGASEKLEDRDNTPWDIRKNHTIEYSKEASEEIKLIICADKYSNIKSMIKDYNEMGDELWNKFNAPYKKQKWYYKNLVKSLSDLKDYKVYQDFKEAVFLLFKD